MFLDRRQILVGALGFGSLALTDIGWAASSVDPFADPTATRDLIFEDRFGTLDRTVWTFGRKATTFDSGYYGRSAFAPFGGAEGVDPYSIVADIDALDGTALQITAEYVGRAMSVRGYHGNDLPEYQWISGNLQTARSDGQITKSWRSGYFEARMAMPSHPLTWPAFWLMDSASILEPQTSVEIDVVEHKGFEPRLYGTYLHEWGGDDAHHEGTGVPVNADLTAGYHRYGVLIENGICLPFFERRPVVDAATGKPAVWTISRWQHLQENGVTFWPLLTLALRNDVPFPDRLTPSMRTAALRVDYVRVYGS